MSEAMALRDRFAVVAILLASYGIAVGFSAVSLPGYQNVVGGMFVAYAFHRVSLDMEPRLKARLTPERSVP